MSSVRHKDDIDARRLVEAAAWRTYLTENNAESHPDFEAWLAKDQGNVAAWRQVQAPWDLFGEQATSPELIEARRVALGQARDVGRRRWLDGYMHLSTVKRAIAASVLLAAIGAAFVWNAGRPDFYRTAPGERRVVTLADGSKVSLDSQSELRVRFTDTSRDLTLIQGQARFDVARDVERPFAVLAGKQKVVALGTAFNVDLLGSNILVTLIEGRVMVIPAPNQTPIPSGHGIELTAGEQLVISPATPPNIVTVNVDRATAWQSGQLVFENEPLSSVTERISRYSERPLVVTDPRIAKLRISGVFNAGDIDGFVATITSYLPVHADTNEKDSIELSAR